MHLSRLQIYAICSLSLVQLLALALHLDGSTFEDFDVPGTDLTLHMQRFPKLLGLQDAYMTIIETLSISAIRINQGDTPSFVSTYKWVHGSVLLFIEAQEYGRHLTWFRLVQIMQGLASFCERRGFWAAIIDVMENESQQIGRVSFWTST
ncbi:MAG: hypothetical protein HETSPECPRED_002196 [Heterodermia speciosa]|uniref:Uncharacterized protein n=1 Tax=Heterodermia speciosa TaxID=116794 RepID=A0A8H3J461_9LECA|nr:MAG: hypothetical protein HETSPECPRED_002196 [Heterodermia speciosa]